jgi:hypothetical protein
VRVQGENRRPLRAAKRNSILLLLVVLNEEKHLLFDRR